MVANAGIAVVKPLLESTQKSIFLLLPAKRGVSTHVSSSASPEEFDRVISINLRGTMLCYKYAAMQMIKQGAGGRIIGQFAIQIYGPALTTRPFRPSFPPLTGASSMNGKVGEK